MVFNQGHESSGQLAVVSFFLSLSKTMIVQEERSVSSGTMKVPSSTERNRWFRTSLSPSKMKGTSISPQTCLQVIWIRWGHHPGVLESKSSPSPILHSFLLRVFCRAKKQRPRLCQWYVQSRIVCFFGSRISSFPPGWYVPPDRLSSKVSSTFFFSSIRISPVTLTILYTPDQRSVHAERVCMSAHETV